MNFKKVTVVVGHYGSGKTNIALNIAVSLGAVGRKVTAADLDTVNPYFRTADAFKDGEFFLNLGTYTSGIKLAVSKFANGNLDIPALGFGLNAILENNSDRYFVIDAGGDDTGASALGRYNDILSALPSDRLDVFFVANRYRYLTKTAEEASVILREIERACGLKVTCIVNNSNLGAETDIDVLRSSKNFGQRLEQETGLPVIFSYDEKFIPFAADGRIPENKLMPIKIYTKSFY